MAPRVLISDALSAAAVQIFKDRGVEVDFQPNLGKDKDKLAEIVGNYDGLAIRSATKVIADWVAHTPWAEFLARVPATRSNTSVCLKVVDPAITSLSTDAQSAFAKALAGAVEKEGAGYDLGHYRDAPAGLRIWCGATIEASDVEILTHWLDWAFAKTKDALPKAA